MDMDLDINVPAVELRPAELHDLTRRQRHQRLGSWLRSSSSKAADLKHLLDLNLKSADLAFLLHCGLRLDWALDALCLSDNGDRPLPLLDCRIERAAVRTIARRWRKQDQAKILLGELESRLSSNAQSIPTASGAQCLLALFDTLSPMGRVHFVQQLLSQGPSIGGGDDVRSNTYDQMISSFRDNLPELLASPLENLLPVCSSNVLISVLDQLNAGQLAGVSSRIWTNIATNHPRAIACWIFQTTSLPTSVAHDHLLPVLCSDRSKSDTKHAILVTQGQQFYHKLFTSEHPLRSDQNAWSLFQAAVCLGSHVHRRDPQRRRAEIDAVIFLFNHHLSVLKDSIRSSWHGKAPVARVVQWLLRRRAEGDLTLAAEVVKLLTPKIKAGPTKRLKKPECFRMFALGQRPWVLAHSNSRLDANSDNVWESFLHGFHESISFSIDLLRDLDRQTCQSLLSKVKLSKLDCDEVRYACSPSDDCVPDPQYRPFGLLKQSQYMYDLLRIPCQKQQSYTGISLDDYDSTTKNLCVGVLLDQLMTGADSASDARALIKSMAVRKTKSSETRGHFAKIALATALATRDADLIAQSWESLLSRIVRDYGARQACFWLYAPLLNLSVLQDTFATLQPSLGDKCMLAFAEYVEKRRKERDFNPSTENQTYLSFAATVLWKRLKTVLAARTTESNVVQDLASLYKVWASLEGQSKRMSPKVGSIPVPWQRTPRALAVGQWIDSCVTELGTAETNPLPWSWSNHGEADLRSFAPVLADRMQQALYQATDSSEHVSALRAWLEMCGDTTRQLDFLCELWDSQDTHRRQILLRYLIGELRGYKRSNPLVDLALSWNEAGRGLVQKLYNMGYDNLSELLHDPQRASETKSHTNVLWYGICMQKSASGKVNAEYVHNSPNLEPLMHWGSICPLQFAKTTTLELDTERLRALVTSSNPTVVLDTAADTLQDREASSSHRMTALNPKTFKRLPPRATNEWLEKALEVAFGSGTQAKITTAKAVIQAIFFCDALPLERKIGVAESVVQRISHVDVRSCYASILMELFWDGRCTPSILSRLSQYASGEDKGMQTALMAPATAAPLLHLRPIEKVLDFVKLIAGPVLSAAWKREQVEVQSTLVEHGVVLKEAAQPFATVSETDVLSMYTIPSSLLLSLSSSDLDILLAVGLQYEVDEPQVGVIADCIRKGFSVNNRATTIMFWAIRQVDEGVRKKSAVLQALWDWSLSRRTRTSSLWSISRCRSVLDVMAARQWNRGIERLLGILCQTADRQSDNDSDSLLQDLLILGVSFANKHAPTSGIARDLTKSVLAAAAKAKLPNHKLYRLQWLAVPIESGSNGTLATLDEQIAAIVSLLKQLYEDMGGYVCAKEFIDMHKPFKFQSDYPGCSGKPWNKESPSLPMMSRVAEIGAASPDRDFGYFCLQQIIQWSKCVGGGAYAPLLDRLMRREISKDDTWNRLLGMRYTWDMLGKRWTSQSD